MTTNAMTGDGATFGVADTTAGPFTPVAEVKNIGLPEETNEAVAATHLGSGGINEYIVGMGDGGEFTVELNFTAAGYAALRTRHAAREVFAVEAAAPSGASWVANVVPTNLKPGDMEAGVVITGTATYKVTGLPTYTAAS